MAFKKQDSKNPDASRKDPSVNAPSLCGSGSRLYDIPQDLLIQVIQSIEDCTFLVLNGEGQILSWNLGAQKMFGYSAPEVVGQNLSVLFAPESIQAQAPELLMKGALQASKSFLEVTRSYGKLPDQSSKPDNHPMASFELTLLTHPAEGNLQGFCLCIREISKNTHPSNLSGTFLKNLVKEVEDIKFALDVSTIVAITDKLGRITYANDAFCRISKYSREELMGQDHRMINSQYHPKSFFTDLWTTIASGKVWKGEIRNRDKEGSYYWVNTVIVPFLDDNNQVYQYVAIRHDITSRKRIESEMRMLNNDLEARVAERTAELEARNQQLAETLNKLQESESLRSTFVSALTHDLRTPLVAQKRAIEILESQKSLFPSDKLIGLTDRLLSSNDNLLEMVNKLLETYQYESGQIDLLLEAVKLDDIVDECFSDLLPLAEKKKISLITQIPSELPAIPGDKHQLKRVLVNLIGNAIDNIPVEAEIRVSMGQELPPDENHPSGRVVMTVCDTGPGIPSEMLPHLFDRYFTGHKTRKKIGSGLGLYIARMILNLHGGEISVDSVVGKGTCFIIYLPKAVAQN